MTLLNIWESLYLKHYHRRGKKTISRVYTALLIQIVQAVIDTPEI